MKMRLSVGRFAGWCVAVVAFVGLAGCAALTLPPSPTSTKDRLAILQSMPRPPFSQPVQIHWNDSMMPYIEAQSQNDAAMALGLVHAHLRLGQMEFGKRVVSGRVSEMVGPFGMQIDQAIRTIGFRRAAPEIVENLPAETRSWLDAYVAGVNHYKRHLADVPHDMIVLDIDNEEAWTAEDTIALGRLGAADLNWSALLSLLPERAKPGWSRVWRRFAQEQDEKLPSFALTKVDDDDVGRRFDASAPDEKWRDFADLTSVFARAGSNAFALDATRSKSGAPLIASDPHLAFTVPNLWLVAGVSWPGEKIVGIMPAGVPVFVIGRNEHLAWGATNMRQWSSDLVDVTGEPDIEVETHSIKRRALWSSTVEVRVTRYGPILSDASLFPFPEGRDIALRWLGHLPSDELTAYLGVAKARRWEDLRTAMATYGVPGQNLVFAERDGDIGQILAAWLPRRPPTFPGDIFTTREESDAAWSEILTVADMPVSVAPVDGVIASANNKPVDEPPALVSWFFPVDDRVRRIYQRLEAQPKWDLFELADVQRDVYGVTDHALALFIVDFAQDKALSSDARQVLDVLAAWDGEFSTESKGAYVYQAWLSALAPALYDALGRAGEEVWWRTSTHLPRQVQFELETLPLAKADGLVAESLAAAHPFAANDLTWGDVHRVDVEYILGRVPLLGERYKLYDLPIIGGPETVAKSAGPLTAERHTATFGSQSRHLSDLSDPDANFFVLFGGQDGVLNSENFADQVPLWANGEYVQLPLRPSQARLQARYTSVF